MKNAFILLFTLLCCVTLVTRTEAVVMDNYEVISLAGETKAQRDSKCQSVLGDPNDSGSFAHLLQDIFDVIKFGTPVIVIALTIMEYIKAITSSDKDQISKANKKTIQRLILGAVLFCIPVVLDFVLNLLGMYGNCGIS